MIEYRITDDEDGDRTVLVSHDFEKIWEALEAMGDDRGHMSVSATVDDPDDENDAVILGHLNGYEVWEYGEGAWE